MYSAQTVSDDYQAHSYRKKERWDSFWHQIDLVLNENPKSLLEVGPGPGIVADKLRSVGIDVKTCDIAEDTCPDVIGSITALPFTDKSFDVVLAAEVLEHICAEDVTIAFAELARVSRNVVIVSVPTPGMSFLFVCKIPCLPKLEIFFKIPFFWRKHEFDGQHYWELSTKGRSRNWFLSCAQRAGLEPSKVFLYPDAPYHCFFVFKRKIK